MARPIKKATQDFEHLRKCTNEASQTTTSGATLFDRVESHYANLWDMTTKDVVVGRSILEHPIGHVRKIETVLGAEPEYTDGAAEFEWSSAKLEDDPGDQATLAGGGAIILNGRFKLVHEWLDTKYDGRIDRVANATTSIMVPGLLTELRPYQERGVARMIQSWQEPAKTCILGDEMGLGKSLQTIIACLQDKPRLRGRFDLIVTTKSCVPQWMAEATRHFVKGQQPIMYHLKDQQVTAEELLNMDLDFVVISYNFLESQYRLKCNVEDFFATAQLRDQQTAESEYPRRLQKRVNLSLLSDVYRALDLPIRHVVLDECQYAKNDLSSTHKAIKALHFEALAALSGTFVTNKWYDLYGILHLMPGENPFETRRDFHRVFGNQWVKYHDPPPTRLDRLIKTLLAMTIARPSTILHLPELKLSTKLFHLDPQDSNMVLYFTKLFVDHLKKAKHRYSDINGILTSSDDQRAIIYATRAQQWAAHPALAPIRQVALHEIVRRMFLVMSKFEKQIAHEEPEILGTKRATKLIRYLEEDVPAQTELGTPDDGEADLDYDPKLDHEEDTYEDDLEDDEQETKAASQQTWFQRIRNMTDVELFSPRIEAILEVYGEWLRINLLEKIVVFSKFRKFLDILTEAFRRRWNVEALRFDGTKTNDERIATVLAFQSSKTTPLLITPRSEGAGLNLEFASKLIQAEIWWVGNEESQAYARLHRSGQTKPVEAVIIEGTDSPIDGVIKAARDCKMEFNEKIMGPLRREDHEAPVIPKIYKQLN